MNASAAPPFPLWERWKELEPRLRAADRLLACFDYDGTLTPIRSRPEEVTTPRGIAAALERLASCPRTVVAVASGRPAADLVGRLPSGLWIVGSHGLEIATPDGRASMTRRRGGAADPAAPLRRLATGVAARWPGVRLEEKGPLFALHVRAARPETAALVTRTFAALADAAPGLRAIVGKQVVEVLPRHVGKASGLRALQRRLDAPALTLYAGDDTTDEDVFAALAGEGALTIHVGDRPGTAARYRVPRVLDVLDLVERLAALRGPAAARASTA